MRKTNLLLGLALAGGLLGFALRRWQLSTAYNTDTQLFTPGAGATYILLALLAALAAAIFFLSREAGKPVDFIQAYRCPQPFFMALMASSAFVFLGAGLLGLMAGMEQLTLWRIQPETHLITYPVALLLCAVMCFPAGIATLLLGKGAYRGDVPANNSMLATLPAFTGLIFLFSTHLAHSTDPVLLNYGFSLAAVIFLMLGQYYVAAFFHERPHPRRAVFCTLMGIILGLTSLADVPPLSTAALIFAFLLSTLALGGALLRNTFGPPWPKRLLEERMPSELQHADQSETVDPPHTDT